MVNPAIPLYNFYKRYLWGNQDFEAWQDGMVDLGRGMFEGLMGAAVLQGFGVSLPGGLEVDVASGVACGPSGYLLAVSGATAVTSLTAPTAGVERALIVIRPNVVNGTMITLPTDPSTTVPLTSLQEAVVAVIRGVAANSPSYPATQAGDTVLCGVRLATGAAALATSDLDFSVQDTVGKNANFNHFVGLNDDRLRPYRVGNQSLGVKPSQTVAPLPKGFSFVTPGVPSIFPKASGAFSPADTFLSFQSGAITGGDTTSLAFTPTVPAAGTAVVATVGLTTSDTLAVKYGTQGTRAQCFAAITNQTTVGAGAVSLPTAKLIAFVVVYSADGVNVTEVDFVDARSFGAFVAAAAYPGYDVVIGGSGVVGATHATLAAAVADSATGNNLLVLLADSQTLANSAVNLTKAGWNIDALPGVTYTAGGASSTICFQQARQQLRGLRFSGFSGASPITFNGSGSWARIKDCYFASITSANGNVDTSGAPTGTQFPVEEGSISE